MRSVAFTLGWELWRRHRLWFVLTAAYLAAGSAVWFRVDLARRCTPVTQGAKRKTKPVHNFPERSKAYARVAKVPA